MEKTDLKKKIQLQNLIIITMSICIVILLGVSFTAAWYIRTRTSSIDIVLSDPVNINITINDDVTNEFTVEDPLDTGSNRVYPGDKIKLKLGVVVGALKNSSPAYVRVKLAVRIEDTTSGGGDSYIDDTVIKIDKDPDDTSLWKHHDFDLSDDVEDYWYVLSDSDVKAKVAQTGDAFTFVDGVIELSKQMTNQYANKKITIVFMVEAIQTENVSDPLAYPGFGPWYGNDDEYGVNP